MAKQNEDAATNAALKARLMLLRSGVEEAARRKKAEAVQHKTSGDGRSLRPDWRTGFFNVRAHPSLRDACMAAAKAEGMKLAEWTEIILLAALNERGHDTTFMDEGR